MGEADDQVQVSVSDGTDTFGRQWTVGKMLKGDFNGDRTVNFNDFLLFVQTFGKTSADLEFDAGIDLNGSGQIDFPDFLTFARYFGLSAP